MVKALRLHRNNWRSRWLQIGRSTKLHRISEIGWEIGRDGRVVGLQALLIKAADAKEIVEPPKPKPTIPSDYKPAVKVPLPKPEPVKPLASAIAQVIESDF